MPKRVYIEALLMDNGEILHKGRTLGWIIEDGKESRTGIEKQYVREITDLPLA